MTLSAKTTYLLSLSLAIVLATASIIAAFWWRRLNAPPRLFSVFPYTRTNTATDIARRNVIGADRFLLPNIVAKGTVNVPPSADIAPLLLEDVEDVSIASASYPDGSKGNVVEMTDVHYPLQSLVTLYSRVGHRTGWKLDYGGYTGDEKSFGLVSMESDLIDAEIVITATASNSYSVAIQTRIKHQ